MNLNDTNGEKKSNQLLIPPTLQRVLPRTITGVLNTQNKDSGDWAWQGFIAYGSQSSVVVIDPITLQCVQTLNKHSTFVTKVKWRKTNHYHQISSPYTLILASADANGVICIWNVSNGEVVASLQDGTRPILEMEWIEAPDGCEHLLAVLHPTYSLVIWDTKHSTKVWKKSYTENLISFQFDPFHANKMAFLCQGCILLVDDFNVKKSPSSNGNRFYLSVPNQSPSQTTEDKASLRKRVRELVSGETKAKNEEASQVSECQQLLYHRTIHDQILLLYPKEVLILDLVINQTVGVIAFERSMSNLVQVIPCWQRDVIYCLHESGSVSTHIRRQLNLNSNSKDQNSSTKDESMSEMLVDMIYDKKCHSEPLRLSKSNRPMTFVLDPLSEKQLCLILGDGRLVFKEFMVVANDDCQESLFCSTKLTVKDNHFSPDFGANIKMPPLSLSSLIAPTYEVSPQGELKNCPKENYTARLMMTGLMSSLSTPLVIRMCPPLTTRNLNVYMPLIAVGTSNGTVQVINLATGVIQREFSLHTFPVRGVEWTSLTSFLSFANQPLTNSQGRVRNELVHTDTKTGYSITLRGNKTEESAIEMIRISYLKQYFIVVLKDDPFELWDCQTLTPLRTMPRKFPKVSALEWSPTTHVKTRRDSSTSESKVQGSDMLNSTSNDDLSASRKSSLSDNGKVIIKENLIFTDIQGHLYRFSVEGNVIKDGNKNIPDPQMNLITGIARKSNDIVLSDSDGVLAILDLKSRTSKHVNTHRGWIKKLRFAPGKDNMKLLVLYADGVDIWDIREVVLVAQLKSPKSILKILDIDWGASDRPVLATIDCSLRIMDIFLKSCTSPINNYFTRDAVLSPYLMSGETALNLKTLMIHQNWKQKYSLDFDTKDGFDEIQLKMVKNWVTRLPSSVVSYLEKCDNVGRRALIVAHLFGDKGELVFWTIVCYYLTKGNPPSLQLDSNFYQLCHNSLFKMHEVERLMLHEGKDMGGSLRQELGRRLAVIGERDRVVRLLLDEDPLKPQFYTDCLRACLLSATHHSTQAQSTIKLVATNLIAAGNIWEGIELLCMIGKCSDGCRYLQSYGHWKNSIWLAKCVLSQKESVDLVKRYAQHLINSGHKDLGVSFYVSTGSVSQAVEQLVSQHYHQRAALLLEAYNEIERPPHSIDEDEDAANKLSQEENLNLISENIYKKYVLFLYGLGNRSAVEHFCLQLGQSGKMLLKELESL